jgi:hypothetical protein
MAVATMVLLVLFFLVLLLLGLGVTADIVQSNHITWPLLSGIPALLDFGSFQSNLFWFIALVVDIAAVVPARRATLRDSYGALRTEGVLLLLMALICISALVCGFGLPGLLRSDTSGQLVWLTSVVSLGVVLGIAALVMLVLEVFYYTRWQHNFLEARERGLERLNREHLRNTEAVKTFISDTIAVQLLMRTGLLGADGGPGPYYNHIALLNNHLRNILDRTSKQQRLAAQRLGSNMNSAQPVSRNRAAGEWLRLRIREEFLDIPVLVDGYKRWQSILEKDSDQVKHFTELLLRMMGQEVPAQVEQQFREHAPLNNYEQHQARILLEVLVSIILRFTMAPESLGSLTGVYERYETLKDGYLRALPVVGVLLQTLDEQISQVAINPMAESGSESPRVRTEDRLQLATEAFATWGQVLWDHQDNRLDRCLTRQGVLAKMMDDPDYEPLGLMRQIGLRVALFANSLQVGQRGDAYLMLSPSDQSRRFRQSLSIDTTGIRVTEFPDNERLILFYIQRYGGPPQRLGIGAGPASTQSSGRGDMASLATATAGVSASAIVMPVNDDESIPAPLDESVIDGASASPTA